MRRTNAAVFIGLACCLSLCAAQISVPLNKKNIQDTTDYVQEAFYTLDLEFLGENHSQKLSTLVDLQDVRNWVVDSTCPNCLGKSANLSDSFSCGTTCGTEVSDDPAIKLVGGKVRVNKHIVINRDVSIEDKKISITQITDVTSLKEGNVVPTENLYLNQVKAGLGFGAGAVNDSKSGLSELFAVNDISPREFSLFFNQNMGRLIVGKPEPFFGSNGSTFKAVKDETDKTTSWALKVGPTLKVGEAPLISTQTEETASSESGSLFQASLDSTTKFVGIPESTFDRLDRTLFAHNNCVQDNLGANVCDCTGTWVPIELSLVKDYTNSSLEGNLQVFPLDPASYLETITSGESAGKCLLLVKQNSVGDLEYTLGTTFLSKYYANFNLDDETITLSEAKGLAPSTLHIDDNYRLPFVIAGSILALALVGGLFVILKQTKAPSDAEVQNANQLAKSRIQHTPATTISYLVRSPRQIESLQQVSQYVKVQGPGGSPIHARVINSPQRSTLGYSQAQPQTQQYYQH